MSAHTPGPWVTSDGSGPNPHGRAIQEAGGRQNLIASCVGFCSREVDEANARLIAAAPELLAALIELNNFKDNHPDTDSRRRADAMARAAIAKATGDAA